MTFCEKRPGNAVGRSLPILGWSVIAVSESPAGTLRGKADVLIGHQMHRMRTVCGAEEVVTVKHKGRPKRSDKDC